MQTVDVHGTRIPSLGYGTYGMGRSDMMRMLLSIMSAVRSRPAISASISSMASNTLLSTQRR